MHRLAVVVSHPVQYHAPWFRALAKVTDLEVFFCHRQDAAGQAAAGFGVEFEWDVPLLDGYKHTWLVNTARHPNVSSFFGCDTPELADRLRTGAFDACIVSGWYLKSYMQAILGSQRAGIRVIARGDSQLATSRSPVWRAVKYVPYRKLLRSIDAHLYVGKANRAYLEHYGVSDAQLFFAPHFVDNEFFATRARAARAAGDVQDIRRQLEIPERAIVFAFAGKFIDKKRPADLIHALSIAHKSDSNIWGMLIGSGPLESELSALASSLAVPVRFAGFRNQTEIPAHLAASDALVLPSDGGETWGLVVNEAMACGLPAIVSDAVGCAADLVEPGKTGYQFPLADIGRLATSIETLARDLVTRRQTVTDAVALKIAEYSCEAAVQGTLAALDGNPAAERPAPFSKPQVAARS